MALDAFSTEINTLREAASTQIRTFQNDREAVKTNPNLSATGKQQVLDESRANVKAELAKLSQQEEAAIAKKLDSLEQSLHTRLGDSGADLIAIHDAEERADNLDEQRDAVRAIKRAIRSNDRPLAYAVIRRANEMGWTEAIDTAAEAYPDAGEALRDIRDLTRFRDDINQVLSRQMSYYISDL